MRHRNYIAGPLGIVAVITFALVFILGYMGIAIYGYQKAQQQKPNVTQGVTITLPQKCRPLLGDGTSAWQDCMGVGKK